MPPIIVPPRWEADHREPPLAGCEEAVDRPLLAPGAPGAGLSQAGRRAARLVGTATASLLLTTLALATGGAVSRLAAPPQTTDTQGLGLFSSPQKPWWRSDVMYQIYPRSFQDSDGDGMGDLNGIRQRLPFLKEFGVGIVWLSPIMLSPMWDGGYDITDYFQIDPIFGTLLDLMQLVQEAHKLGMRILMEFVPNHTSNMSKWFQASRSSKTDPKRNWYVWNPGKLLPNGTRVPPNNWAAQNTDGSPGSAWTWDNATQEYYLHQFSAFQPDLNYANPAVVSAMQDVLRFWMRLGVDGFRVDAVNCLLEDPLLRDEPIDNLCMDGSKPALECMDHKYTLDVEGIHEIILGWRRTVDEFDNRAMVAQIGPSSDTLYFGTEENPEFHLVFNFRYMESWRGAKPALSNATYVRDTIWGYTDAKPAWAQGSWVLGSHDVHRLMARVHNNSVLAAALQALHLLLPGTPTLYYGDEIAMRDLWIPYDQCQDPKCIEDPRRFAEVGRDPSRTPMQWERGPQAGFSPSNATWLPVNPDHDEVNVAVEHDNASSPLHTCMRTLQFRANFSELAVGRIIRVPVLPAALKDCLVVVEYTLGQSFWSFAATLANLCTLHGVVFDFPPRLSAKHAESQSAWQVLFSTFEGRASATTNVSQLSLSPGEVLVVALQGSHS